MANRGSINSREMRSSEMGAMARVVGVPSLVAGRAW